MARIELIGVPFDGYGRTGNQASASAVLREAGIAAAFTGHDVIDTGDLDLPAPQPTRGRLTTLVNEPALLALAETLRSRVRDAVERGHFPVVYGGDCTTLLGTMPGLRDITDRAALLFIDGHEDTMPLDVSEDGEAANTEIGLLLGLTGRILEAPLHRPEPALTTETLAMLGPRDLHWRRRFNVGTLRDLGVYLRTAEEVAADPAAAATGALRHLSDHADLWWLHIDLDVLDPDDFAAQGLPDVPDDPGGLTWAQLRELATNAVRVPGCVGWSLAIYDPDQDPTRADAGRIVRLAQDVAASLPGVAQPTRN